MSKTKVLMLDDEPNVLSAYRRSIGRVFDLNTFTEGAEAIKELSGPTRYPVVVTDMRMPTMDGLQFVLNARKVAPHSVFIMLTGNADQQTAIDAINTGQVFRFLNKPCDGEELEKCIRVCLKQYELQQAERELLRDTLSGSVNLMMEILSLSQPQIASRTQDIRTVADQLIVELGESKHVHLSLASSFALIGAIALAPCADGAVEIPDDDLEQAAALGERLLEKIPRLKQVARIVGAQRLTGKLPEKMDAENLVDFGGRFLRFVVDWNTETIKSDGNQTDGFSKLKMKSAGMYDHRLIFAAENLVQNHAESKNTKRVVKLSVEARHVRERDTLTEAIMTKEGTLVLAKDCVLSGTMVERIKAFSKSGMLNNSEVNVLRECQEEGSSRDAA